MKSNENAFSPKVVFHEADEGGYWAEIPAFPGCVSEGDTLEEAQRNITEAAQCWLGMQMRLHFERDSSRRVRRAEQA